MVVANVYKECSLSKVHILSKFKIQNFDIIVLQIQIKSRRLSLRSLLTAGMRVTLIVDNYTRLGYWFISFHYSIVY